MPDADVDHVYKKHLKFLDAMVDGNVDFLVSCFTDDAVIFAPGQPPARGTEAIRAWFEDAFAQAKTEGLAARNEDYLQVGDVIVEAGEGTWEMTPQGGQSVSQEIKWLAVWQRQQNGAWKIVRDIFN